MLLRSRLEQKAEDAKIKQQKALINPVAAQATLVAMARRVNLAAGDPAD
jgi:hypothetical protein